MALIMESADDVRDPGAGGPGGRNGCEGSDGGCDGIDVILNAKGLNGNCAPLAAGAAAVPPLPLASGDGVTPVDCR